MKTLFTLTLIIALTITVFAQSPQKMSYQAVIRNISGTLVTNQATGMRISILQGSATGTPVYVETQTPTTNANGLATIEIGGGTPVTGTFAGINWASGPYYIKTETDPEGGTSYAITGTSQLLSVPYALYSEISGNLADNSVTSGKIVDGTIIAADLGSNSINSAKITDASVIAADLAANAVTTDKINTGAVTGAKIAQAGATSGQVLKWNGTIWAPNTDLSSLWSQNGPDIYYNTGKVGIGGINTSVAQFQVKTTGSEIARFESTATSNWIGLYTSGVRKGLIWLNTNTLTIRSDEGAVNIKTNGNNERLTIEDDGDITTPVTGSNKNIVPVAYGYVNQLGQLYPAKSTTNVTSMVTGSAGSYNYIVTISGVTANSFIALVTPGGDYISFPRVMYSDNTFTVNFMSHTGTTGDANNFSFVVFAP